MQAVKQKKARFLADTKYTDLIAGYYLAVFFYL